MREGALLASCLLAIACHDEGAGLDAAVGDDLSAEVDLSLTDAGAPPDQAIPPDLSGPCPAAMALIAIADGGVCVDRYEAALVAVTDGGDVPYAHDQPVGATIVRAVVAAGVVPQSEISALQAEAACQLANKRLCTRAEWEAACRGAALDTHPYGSAAGVCNTSSSAVAVAGSASTCVTPTGIYDLEGNVNEWVSDVVSGGHGVFKGGSYADATLNGIGCLYTTTAHLLSFFDATTGFRCCAPR